MTRPKDLLERERVLMMLEAKAICAEGCEHYKRAEAFRECIEIVKQMRNTEGVRLKGLSEDCESCRI